MTAFFLDLAEDVPEAVPGALADAIERLPIHRAPPQPVFTYRKRPPPTPERMAVLQSLMERRASHSRRRAAA